MNKGYSSKAWNGIMQTTPSYYREKYNPSAINQVNILSPTFCKDIINRTPQMNKNIIRTHHHFNIDYMKQIRSNSRHEDSSLNQYQWKSTYTPTFQTNLMTNNYMRINKIDPLVYPKNQRKLYMNNPTETYTKIKVINETEVIMIQSLWRGILVRKQVAEQLTLYYRNRDFVSLTMRLVTINMSDAFNIIKNRLPKKKVMLTKKTNCFKANITQASLLYQRNKDSNIIIESNPNDIITANGHDNREQSNDNPKLQKKKVILKAKPKEKTHYNIEEELKTKTTISDNLKSITPQEIIQSNDDILNNDLTENCSEINIKQGNTDIIAIKPFNDLQISSFISGILQSDIKIQSNQSCKYIEERVNMVDIIQSKLRQFNVTNFHQDNNTTIAFIPDQSLKQDKDIKLPYNLFIDNFILSFFSISKTQTIPQSITNYSQESILTYSYSPIRVPILKSLPKQTEIQRIDSKASLSSRTLLSRRFHKFIQDDLIDYPSYRNNQQTEPKFSFQTMMTVNDFETSHTYIELIAMKELCDTLIIPQKHYSTELKDSIFTHKMKRKNAKYRKIISFNLTLTKPDNTPKFRRTSLFKVLLDSSLHIVPSISFSIIDNDNNKDNYNSNDNDKSNDNDNDIDNSNDNDNNNDNSNDNDNHNHNDLTSFKVSEQTNMRLRSKKSPSNQSNNKNQLPNLLYTIINKKVIIFVSSILYQKFMLKNKTLKYLLLINEEQSLKYYFKYWKRKHMRYEILEEINCQKKSLIHSCVNEISIVIKTNISNSLIKENSNKNNEEKEMILYSERTKNISSFKSLTANADASFQLLNIKTHIVHHHYSHRNKALTLKPFTTCNESFLSSYHYNSVNVSPVGKKLNRKSELTLEIQYQRKSLLWLIIPKQHYKLMKSLVKHFIKWKMISLSLKNSHYKIYVLKRLVKIRSRNYLKMIVKFIYNSIWKKWTISKVQKKSFQLITFRTLGLSLKDQLILESINHIYNIIQRHWFKRLFKNRSDFFFEKSISSQNISFSSSNNCLSPGPSNRIRNVLICDEEGDKVLRVKHVRHKSKKDSLKTSYSQESTTKKYGKQMKIRFVKKGGPIKMPPRLIIPINTKNNISVEKFQLKKFVHEIKNQKIKNTKENKEIALIKIVNNYYMKSSSHKKLFNNLHLSLNRWHLTAKLLSIHNIIKQNKQLYSMQYLSLHIPFTQWRYCNNTQVQNKKKILQGLSHLSLLFNTYHKRMIVLFLKLK